MRFESLCNVVGKAEDANVARKKIATGGWVTRRGPYNRFSGKVIPLFHRYEDCSISEVLVLGIIPFTPEKGDDPPTASFFRDWAGAVLLLIDAPSRDEANAFLQRAEWHAAVDGVEVHSYTQVMPEGTLERVVA